MKKKKHTRSPLCVTNGNSFVILCSSSWCWPIYKLIMLLKSVNQNFLTTCTSTTILQYTFRKAPRTARPSGCLAASLNVGYLVWFQCTKCNSPEYETASTVCSEPGNQYINNCIITIIWNDINATNITFAIRTSPVTVKLLQLKNIGKQWTATKTGSLTIYIDTPTIAGINKAFCITWNISPC